MANATPHRPSSEQQSRPESEDRYRLLFEKAREYLILFELERDAQGNLKDYFIRDVNPMVESFSEQPRDYFVNRRGSELAENSERFSEFLTLMREVAETGQPRQVESYHPPSERFFLYTIYPLDGDLYAAIGMDITETKDTQRALEESRLRLAFTTEAAEVGVWDWDTLSDTLVWNDELRGLFDIDRDADVSYSLFLERIHPQDRAWVDASVQKSLSDLTPFEIEYRVQLPDGEIRWIHSRGRAYHDENQHPERMTGVALDVTRRKLAESERERVANLHRRQNELMERLLRDAPIGIAILEGSDHRYAVVNPAYLAITRATGRLIGRTIKDVWGQNAQQFLDLLNPVYETGRPASGTDVPFILNHGRGPEATYLTFTLTPHMNLEGEVEGLIFLAYDTTEQVKNRKQVEFEQSRLEALFRSAPVGIVLADEQARLVRANPIAENILGVVVPPEKPVHEPVLDLQAFTAKRQPVAPDEFPLHRSAVTGETVQGMEMILRRKSGAEIPVLFSSAPVRSASGKVIGAVGVFQDITDRKQAENDRARAAAQIEVHHHLIQSREMERTQIAHRLHEGLLQELIGLQFAIEEALDEPQKEIRLEKMNSIQRTLVSQIRELRDYCYELRPPALAAFGLEKAIRSHAESYRDRYLKLQIHLDLLPDAQFLPESIRLVLFRVYQEVMNNAALHSKASEVTVRFIFNSRQAILEIRDNGSGFTLPTNWVEAARRGQLGLASAQERVESVGGTMNISSQAGQGTRVLIKVPLAHIENKDIT